MNEETDIIQNDGAFEASYEDNSENIEEALSEENGGSLPEGSIGEAVEGEPEAESEGAEAPSEESDANTELSKIKDEIIKLKEELRQLDELKTQSERMLKEFDEFLELFPEKRIESIPDEVWDQAKNGTSLAAAYALYEKKREASQRLAAKVNAKNVALSAGKAGNDAAGEYFSYEQVKGMSQAEVRKNYAKIRESMKKWN